MQALTHLLPDTLPQPNDQSKPPKAVDASVMGKYMEPKGSLRLRLKHVLLSYLLMQCTAELLDVRVLGYAPRKKRTSGVSQGIRQ